MFCFVVDTFLRFSTMFLTFEGHNHDQTFFSIVWSSDFNAFNYLLPNSDTIGASLALKLTFPKDPATAPYLLQLKETVHDCRCYPLTFYEQQLGPYFSNTSLAEICWSSYFMFLIPSVSSFFNCSVLYIHLQWFLESFLES